MLQANELMIGDWVYCRYLQKNVNVEEIKTVADDELRIIVSDGIPIVFAMRYIEPIPLTPEILEKNGFVEVKHYYPCTTYEYVDDSQKFLIRVAFPKNSKATERTKPFVEVDAKWCWHNSDCEFFHELQHVLHDCRIKKEMML